MNNIYFYNIVICISVIFLFTDNNIYAQNKMKTANNKFYPQAEFYKNELAKTEADYKLIFYLEDKINDDNVHIFRFEPESSTNVTINGAHVTVILDENNKLKGFAQLSEAMTGKNEIDEKEGMIQALLFFKKHAPDLNDAKYQWSDSHEEKLIGSDGKEKKINGKWVKYRDEKTGQYLWVILAPDKTIMEFDRDIIWSFFRGGRVNELWLRDSWFNKWLLKNNKK